MSDPESARKRCTHLWATWYLRLRVGVSAMYAAFCDGLRLEFLSLGDWWNLWRDMYVRSLNIFNQGFFFILKSVFFSHGNLVSLVVDISTQINKSAVSNRKKSAYTPKLSFRLRGLSLWALASLSDGIIKNRLWINLNICSLFFYQIYGWINSKSIFQYSSQYILQKFFK